MIKRYHITVKHYDLGTPDPDFFIAYVMDDHGRDLYPEIKVDETHERIKRK